MRGSRGGLGGPAATPNLDPSPAVAGKWTAGSLSGSANRYVGAARREGAHRRGFWGGGGGRARLATACRTL